MDTSDPDAALQRMLSRGAVDLLTVGESRGAEWIDLIQMSAYTRNLLAPEGRLDNPGTKLTGVTMSHFGAFTKRSWRANDWMWGRLDGAGWLMHMVLTPNRLRQAAAALKPAADRREQIAALTQKLREIACASLMGLRTRRSKTCGTRPWRRGR